MMIFGSTVQALSFGRKDIEANHIFLISKMIKIVQPDLKKVNRNRIAKSIYLITKNYKVDPKLMVAIIGTESSFVNSKISETGDLSIAQINTRVWNKEFNRLGISSLDPKLLKRDEAYALKEMAVILNIIKARHAKTDHKWFARYHSHTKKYKDRYVIKVEKRMKMIASIN